MGIGQKRPGLFLKPAAVFAGYRFVMTGRPCPGQGNYYEEILRKAETLGNLKFLGPVPYSKVNQYFARAKVFVKARDRGFSKLFLTSLGVSCTGCFF